MRFKIIDHQSKEQELKATKVHILHGNWLIHEKQFAFWGEDTGLDPQHRKGRRGKTAPHPFPVSVDHLLHYLDLFTTESSPDGQSLTIWLPGFYKQVQPSPEAEAAGLPPPTATSELLAWEVNAITLTSSDFIDFMLQLPVEPQGFVVGSDLRYWQQIALLTMNGLAEGRFIPIIEQRGNQYYSRWAARPDMHLLEQLQLNMPPLCRAIASEISAAPQPSDLLHDCMDTLTDMFIRGNASKSGRISSNWIMALTKEDHQIVATPAQNRKLFNEWEQWQTVDGLSHRFRVWSTVVSMDSCATA